jgi:FlaA1/EpsC-like NDP-sugar epimerase
VIGFIDDDPRKRGLILQGITVLGTGTELSQIAKNQQADLILIAVPSASGGQMRRIFESCTAAGVPYKTIPGLAAMMEEGGLAGSEICRQIAQFGPKLIIGYDIAESPMFHLEQELRRLHPGLAFRPELGSIQNTQRLRETFTAFSPTVVYHAAAYKHVPLMESHAFEAIENNVFGTLNVVQAARHFGVREFVMISSDKAVRPANVMGATKRMAELVVRSLQPEDGRYVSVRFGNVLGSNGSVVPIFKDQIARGGPVTVTHPEMSRYFMTIPEACQLVLQASTMGRGGEIFVLDMGEPVKIVDLARNLILLSGLRPDVDVRIEFTGTRPGEKLTEELSVLEEGLLATHHEKIRVFSGLAPDWDTLAKSLNTLRGACSARTLVDLICGMREIVPEYRPSEELSARADASRETASRETTSSEAA